MDIQAIEAKGAGSRTREERIALKKHIRDYCNRSGYSDTYPFEVVRVVSDRCVEIREMDAVQTGFPKHFIKGGFLAHCADNHAQEWECSSNEENPVIRVRWSKANERWQDKWGQHYYMSNNPRKFYDYNF
jgi:hypothetical protein